VKLDKGRRRAFNHRTRGRHGWSWLGDISKMRVGRQTELPVSKALARTDIRLNAKLL